MEKTDKRINKPKALKGFWSRLWKLIEPSHKAIIGLMVFIMAFEIVRLIGPYLLKLIIDLIVDFKSEYIGKIFILAIAMLGINQLVSVIDYFADKKIIQIILDIELYLSMRAQRKMLELPLGYHEKENTGNKIIKIQRGIDKIDELLSNAFWEVVPTFFQVIFTTIVLFWIDYRFGLAISFFIPIFAYLSIRANKTVFPYRQIRHDSYEEASGQMAQSIININTVKSFVQEKREENNYLSLKEKIKKNHLMEFNIFLNYNIGRNLVIDLGRVSLLLLGVYLAWKGNITVGSLVFIITISEKALLSLFRISRLYDRVMDSSEAITRLYSLEQEKSSVVNQANGKKPKNIVGQITFKDVDFSYDGSRVKALNKVNLKINSGCLTALVGPSGGGKTTIARMIYRHYDPQAGEVQIDGMNIKKMDLFALRRLIAIVPQEVEIFNTSALENISYAKPNAVREEIIAAARIANADEFIKDLPKGYDTLVGERGIKLSGGQRQRMGIARAILANPRILIFDEATSSLDSYSEKLIQDAIDKISKGRTMIIIAHRLSTIKKADKIVVLEKGKVVEEGSHFELAKTDRGLYAKLLNLQQMGDVE